MSENEKYRALMGVGTGITGGIGGIQTVKNTGDMDDLYSQLSNKAWISAGGAVSATTESVVEAPYLILWYSNSQSRYQKIWADNDEKAIEQAKTLMSNEDCRRVEIFELAHRWKRTWEKEP